MKPQPAITIDGSSLQLAEVIEVSRHHAKVQLAEHSVAAVKAARAFVERLIAERRVVYGVTTGFGNFKKVRIEPDHVKELQANLIRSHAVGVGPALSVPEVRAMMLIRANSLAKGYSGVRPLVIETLLRMLNHGVHPFVPEQGSVGASGDLAPLAHVALVMMGEGEVVVDGQRQSAKAVMQSSGTTAVQLEAKEGLALTNGTAFMSAVQSLNLDRARQLLWVADIIGALTMEAMQGSVVAAREEFANLRPHPGHAVSAENIRRLTEGSEEVARDPDWPRIQDSYTLRCLPQVHGAIRDAVTHAADVLQRELNAATDNPLIFADRERVLSGGNFHGEPLALTADYLGIAMAELADISERRIAKLVDPATNEGLPAFLIPPTQAGLSNGFMITQYTAAALVSENKILTHPASVDSIPTSANQEDHVSMGAIAVRKCRDIISNVEQVLAIEWLTAAQAVDLRGSKKLGRGTRAAYELLRRHVSMLERDRVLYPDLEQAVAVVRSGALTETVVSATGPMR
ncbi:MAG: histidine ammonia-lyase [Candidatus Kerfeldbacteria bacterium]|nr:histidine ammonia-lyase [Candidatus Kerfeldbacteria bacterium]